MSSSPPPFSTQDYLRVYVVAGEASGDRLGADLLRALRMEWPHALFYGVGGRHLRAAGQDQLFDLAIHAVVGLTDVLRHYLKFRNFFERIVDDIRQKQPEVLILIDYPGLNLRLASRIRKVCPETRLVYFVSPQVWAWKSHRARMMEKNLDLLIVLFRFEVDWFARHAPKLKVIWRGHPILDRWSPVSSTTEDSREPSAAPVLGLLPGSRKREIEKHLPVLLETARKLSLQNPDLRHMILASDDQAESLIEALIVRHQAANLPLEICRGYTLTRLSRCRAALVASGTATLECAIAGTPMLVIYKTSWLTYLVARFLIRLPYLAMVNVLAGKKIVPEFLQHRAVATHLVPAAQMLIENTPTRRAMIEALIRLGGELGSPGVNRSLARALTSLMSNEPIAATPDDPEDFQSASSPAGLPASVNRC